MTRALWFLAVAVAVFSLASTTVDAEVDLGGEWLVTFTGPTGPAEYTMFVAQEGNRINGRMTSASGEFPLRGSIDGEQFRIVWALPDQGRMLEIVFVGTVTGDTLEGKAQLGRSGEGPVHGERVGR